MSDTTPDPSLGDLVDGYRATDTTAVTAFAATPDTPTTCGALYRLRDPAISGQRAVIFECDREPGHLGPHRERVDGFAATWAGTNEPVRRVTVEPPTPPDLLEVAWGIIANAGHGDWANETPDWQEAAARWRAQYHASLRAPEPKPLGWMVLVRNPTLGSYRPGRVAGMWGVDERELAQAGLREALARGMDAVLVELRHAGPRCPKCGRPLPAGASPTDLHPECQAEDRDVAAEREGEPSCDDPDCTDCPTFIATGKLPGTVRRAGEAA